MNKLLLSILCSTFILAGQGFAQNPPPPAAPTGASTTSTEKTPAVHKTVHKKSVEACTGKAEGDACSYMTSKDKKISGTCAKKKDNVTLYCKKAKGSSGK
jgi:hypothetical protein